MCANVTRFDFVRGLLIAFAGIMITLSPCGISTDGALTVGVSDATANPGPADAGEFAELPSIESLLERYVEAVGGREAILALRTRVALMHIVTDLEWDPPIYEVDTLSVYGTSSGEFLVVTRTPRGVMMEGCDGDEEWKVPLDDRPAVPTQDAALLPKHGSRGSGRLGWRQGLRGRDGRGGAASSGLRR
jgi:hypothetical protein